MSPGFALLSVLLITALVMIAVAGLLSVAGTSASLAHSDAEGSRALGVAEQGTARALEMIRWSWAIDDRPVCAQGLGGGRYSIVATEISPESPLWPAQPLVGEALPSWSLRAYSLSVQGTWGQGLSTVRAVVLVTPDALPRGLVVGTDVSASAPLRLRGCGLYAGGSVRGRDWVALEPPGDVRAKFGDPLPDLAYGGLYETAAVHAGGAIFAADGEVHDAASTGFEGDDDSHTGGGPPAALLEPPDSLTLANLCTHADDPGVALVENRLALDLLPPHDALEGESSCPGNGLIIVIDRRESTTPAVITGDRDAVVGACPLTIVVLGDCHLGSVHAACDQTCFTGALVVTGRLTTGGVTMVRGSVFAGSLDCSCPLTLDAAGLCGLPWQESAPGSSNVWISSWDD